MRNTYPLLISILMTSCITKTDVSLIVHNANIYTIDDEFTVFEAMAVVGDSIVEIGPEHRIMNKYNAKTVIDAEKQHIYPGFIDAHCHFIGYAKNLNYLDLLGCTSTIEMIDRIKEYVGNTQGNWIMGRGWDQNLWEDPVFPDLNMLTGLDSDKYIMLKRVDGHAALVNQKVLDLAEIDENTIVEGGKIEVKNGKCTGILIDNAVDLVTALIPDISENELKTLVEQAQENCFEKGLTSVSDAGLNLREVKLIRKWQDEGILDLKFYLMLNPVKENFDEFLKSGPIQNRDLSIRSFKIYADGALGSRGACLLKPYSDVEGESNFGLLLTSPDSLKILAQKLYNAGFQMNTHAIGDSAIRLIANIYAEVLEGSNDLRWRIEHSQVVDRVDLSLFGKFNIIPSIQPTHATSDMTWAIDRLGDERINNAYAYRSLKEQNGLIALGTDFPVENIDPLLTLLAAVKRTDLDGNPDGGYFMKESLTFEDCIRGMTIWAAIANFEDQSKGSLEAGKKADFVIFNKDLSLLEASNFDKFKVQATYINGKLVFQIK